MFVVFDIGALPVSAREFARRLLARHDVAILPCDGFGVSGGCADLLRVSLCVDDARLVEACGRIVDCVHSLEAP